jgi:hypothetical protein
VTKPAVDHHQRQQIPRAEGEGQRRSLESLAGLLQVAGTEKDRAHGPLVNGYPPGGPLANLDQPR